MTKANWKPMSEAPKDRRILLKYAKPFSPGIYVVAGSYYHDKGIAKPRPYWSNDLMIVKGAVAVDITKARQTHPVGWMELPEAANSGETKCQIY